MELGASEDITAVIPLREVCQEHHLRPNSVSRSWAVKCYQKTASALGLQSHLSYFQANLQALQILAKIFQKHATWEITAESDNQHSRI